MVTDLEYAGQRFSAFAKEVLEPAVYPERAALDVAVHRSPTPISHEAAVAAAYEPITPGYEWGPTWSWAWFRLTGSVPVSMAGRPVALRFDTGTEALLWLDGVPRQGLDENHLTCRLHESAEAGAPVRLHVEAACHHPFGAAIFSWDARERRERWASDAPARLSACELVTVDDAAWRLWRTYELARQLLAEMTEDQPRARDLREALAEATRRIDDRDVAANAAPVADALAAALGANDAAATRCVAVGHCHIDTAWLWPISATRYKCRRSFATVLRLMERDDDLVFLCSQPQQYAWLERDAPDLFEQVRQRVAEGRWEAAGAMWIEPDANVPSGESLVRQILHGTRYFRERFGDDAPQHLLYLPDTFGFSAALPQIMEQAGLDTFITNKLSWGHPNEFPYVSFRWRGLDGTEVLAHCTPGHDYNATMSPHEMRRGEKNAVRKEDPPTGVWLQPFGHGDGGGGPTEAMVLNARLAARCEGLPRVTLAGTRVFREELLARREALRTAGRDLPVWDGELYLELHRGTLTTQSWLKRANRRAEHALRVAELLVAVAPRPAADAARVVLDEAWKLTLLNQFHDILPGTSIAEVYVDARRDHERVAAITTRVIDDALAGWASHVDTTGLEAPMLVLNAGSAAARGVVECAGEPHYVENVPALGVRVIDRAHPPASQPVTIDGDVLSNGLVTARIDERGRVSSLRGAGVDRDACGDEPINQLVIYEDRPRSWDAWDIDAEHVEKASPLDGPVDDRRVVEAGALRAAVEVTRTFGADSRITQRYVLEAGTPRLDILTRVHWNEDHRVLRALFPVDVRSRRATYEIQYGHLERPTHRNTSRERAAFEVCAHSWMDVSEAGFGVSLLNDGKYGHSCDGSVMGLTLVRGPTWPDPGADRGDHEFTYALMAHAGSWRAAGVDHWAHQLNAPVRALPLPADRAGTVRDEWAPVTIESGGAAGMVCSALKPAEEDDRLILRLVETHGGHGSVRVTWNLPVASVEPVDLLERGRPLPGFEHGDQCTRFDVRPFQIVTLAARRGTP
ncbi:MAG: alpha-mannosidase [Planctomycetes bacterium]|nr:alpha-mannosidase [Planctomycetota bacterium]